MKNGLNLLLLALLAGCPPVFGQDKTNTAPYGNSRVYGNAAPYGSAGAYSNAGPYGNGTPVPMLAQPPPGMRPALRPPTVFAPRQILPPRAIPPTALTSPSLVRISDAPIPEIRTVNRFGEMNWTVTVCTNADNLTNGCLETGLWMSAIKLEQLFAQEYQQGRHAGELKVILPASLSQAQQTSFLYEVEHAAVETTKRQVLMADGKFALRAGDTPQARQEKQSAQLALNQAVQAWADQAQAEATTGSNWRHDWPANTHTFIFHGAAFEQFKAISQAVAQEPAPGGAGGN